MKPALLLTAAVLAALVVVARAQDGGGRPSGTTVSRVQTLETGKALVDMLVVDVNLDGCSEVVGLTESGEVLTWRHGDGAEDGVSVLETEPAGRFVLPHPSRSLLAVAEVLGNGGPPELVVLSPEGLTAHEVNDRGLYSRGGVVLAPKARFRLRVGRPRFAEILRDLNGDGLADLVLPGRDAIQIWLNQAVQDEGPVEDEGSAAGEPPPPRFVRAARVHTRVRSDRSTRAQALSDVLESHFRVPGLELDDVNGDGRADLLVSDGDVRAFHLQRDDGSIPEEADVTVDLNIFRDTTPQADVRLGRTLAGKDDARMRRRDLDGDGIPDYVIAHRRKVWIFHGSTQGPQFTKPTEILKVAEDVTILLLVRLDEDPRPDLLLVRVQVPTAATLLRGVFSEWDVEIAAAGYRNEKGRTFSRRPTMEDEISLRLPAILSALRNLDGLLSKFEDTANQFRTSVEGDLDGDGSSDVVLTSADGSRLDVWRDLPSQKGEFDAEREIAKVLFGRSDRVWTIDRMLAWLGNLGEQQAAARTGGRPPSASVKTRDPTAFARTALEAADFDGDGRAEILVAYRRVGGDGGTVVDFLRVE